MNIKEALVELRKNEKRKFSQSIDILINLKGIDMKRDSVNAVLTVPHKIKDKKVCAFLNKKTPGIATITLAEFDKYKDKKALKNLVNEYDFFIALAPLMPKIAATFGKVLGPQGKMPSPQLGIIGTESEGAIKEALEKIDNSIKIRMKEPSIKICAAKESMKDEDIEENIRAIYAGIIAALPKKQENIRNVMLKLTMSKPVKVEIK